MAASQQHKVDSQPLATLKISRLVIETLRFQENPISLTSQLSIHGKSLGPVFGGGMPFLTPTN